MCQSIFSISCTVIEQRAGTPHTHSSEMLVSSHLQLILGVGVLVDIFKLPEKNMSFFLEVRGLPLMLFHQMMVKLLVKHLFFSVFDEFNLCSFVLPPPLPGPCCHHDPDLWVGSCLPWFQKVKNGRRQEKQAPFPLPFLPPSWKVPTQERDQLRSS